MQRVGLLPAAEGPWVVLWGVCARIGLYIQPTAAANPIGCSYRHFIVSALDTSPSLGTLVLRGRVDQKWSSGKTHDACRGSLTVDEWKLEILTEFVMKLKVWGQKGPSRKSALLKEQFTQKSNFTDVNVILSSLQIKSGEVSTEQFWSFTVKELQRSAEQLKQLRLQSARLLWSQSAAENTSLTDLRPDLHHRHSDANSASSAATVNF